MVIVDNLLVNLMTEGAYIDYWSVAHGIIGYLIGKYTSHRGLSKIQGGLVVLLIKTGFELIEAPIYEYSHKLFPTLPLNEKFPERLPNQIMDVMLGLVGYCLARRQ